MLINYPKTIPMKKLSSGRMTIFQMFSSSVTPSLNKIFSAYINEKIYL